MAKQQKARAKPWSADTIAQIGAWVTEERSQAWMADKLGITRTGFRERCDRLGIPIIVNVAAERTARGLALLQQHYATHPDIQELRRLYVETTGRSVTIRRLGTIANQAGIHRDKVFSLCRAQKAVAVMKSNMEARRIESAKKMQAIMDTGVSADAARKRLGLGSHLVLRMKRDGLIIPRPFVVPYAPRPSRRAPKPPPVPKPVTYVAPLPPPPPPLPPPAENGKIYAPFAAICGWADQRGIYYDGRQIDKLNAIRAAAGLAPLVQDEGASA